MKINETKLKGCLVLEPTVFEDERGFFLETFHASKYADNAGIKESFVQDNHSRSSKDVLRGLHLQRNQPQGKLVRVVKGEVFDVAVDLRSNSPTFGEWHAVVLSETNKKQFWVPSGFAHGFLVLSEYADLEYKCTTFYDPASEIAICWNDPTLKIAWPMKAPILSEKDRSAKKLNEVDL
tara:strand:- start:111 stop:647 length:537 start_codon:yes stop_codon:yes gene_type:complete